MRGQPELVAVGECGLDYHYDYSPRPAQREVFAAQIRLANSHGLALVVHTREAWDDTFAILRTRRARPHDVPLLHGGPGRGAARPGPGGPAVVQRDHHVQERRPTSGRPPPSAPSTGCSSRPTRRTWRPSRIGAGPTCRRWYPWWGRRWRPPRAWPWPRSKRRAGWLRPRPSGSTADGRGLRAPRRVHNCPENG